MTLSELIVQCRRKTKDQRVPYFWSDEQWQDALNEAEKEACIRARLIEDDTLTADAIANEAYIDLPERAFSVRRASIDGKSLGLFTREDFVASIHGDWESATGTPSAGYRVGDRIRLYPIPQADAIVNLTAFCTPACPMDLSEASACSPGIPCRLHTNLVDWALRLFYSTQDADYENDGLADMHESRFESVFGPRPNEVEIRRTALRHGRSSRCVFF